MSSIVIEVRAVGEETTEACSCCGRPIYEGRGLLVEKETQADLADYWYRWSEGHLGRFVLAVSPCDSGSVAGVAVVSSRIDSGSIIYTVLDPADSPWTGTEEFPVLTRDEVLNEGRVPNLFNIVDAIAANERRLSARILECGEGLQS